MQFSANNRVCHFHLVVGVIIIQYCLNLFSEFVYNQPYKCPSVVLSANKVRKLMPSSQRLVQFEWYGDGIFYELVKSNATNMEETHLVKGNLWDRTICVHKVFFLAKANFSMTAH